MEKNQIIYLLASAIHWASFTPTQELGILEIIEDADDAMTAAGDICEYLDIEKRGNRSSLHQVIKEYFSEFKKTA
jgi:hypothetical protein